MKISRFYLGVIFFVGSMALIFLSPYRFHENLTAKEKAFIKDFSFPQGHLEAMANTLFFQSDIIKAFEKEDITKLKEEGFICHKTWGNIVVEHPALPGWIIKSGIRFFNHRNNIRRITEAEKIRSCITKNNLRHIIVPKKYLFHIPGKGQALTNDNYLIFSEKLPLVPQDQAVYHDEVIREVLMIVKELGIFDASTSNIRMATNGYAAFIDTEPFFEFDLWAWDLIEFLGLKRLKGYIGSHIFSLSMKKRKNKTNFLSNDAQNFLSE